MIMLKKIMWILCFSYCLTISTAVLAEHSFNFATDSPGSPPYLYLDRKTNSYKGLIPDILNEVSKQHAITVNYVDSNQQRIEVFLASGKIDGFFASKAWLENPRGLINSRNITAHKSFLYSTRRFPQDFRLMDIKGSNICTRKHYVYPSVSALFNQGHAQRVDSSERPSMLNMLIKDRCQYTIMHQYNADALIDSVEFSNTQFYRSPLPSNVVYMSIFLRPELTDIKHYIDSVVEKMESNGRLAESINYHVNAKNNLTIIEK
jgi:polar amino acid transport system substrate-binding protein